MVEKKLPKMFANKIEKELNNNKKVFYSKESMQGKERDTVIKPSNENNGTRIAETKNIWLWQLIQFQSTKGQRKERACYSFLKI